MRIVLESVVNDFELLTWVTVCFDEGSESVGWLDGWMVGWNMEKRSSYQKIRKQFTDIYLGFLLFMANTRDSSERMTLITSNEGVPDLSLYSCYLSDLSEVSQQEPDRYLGICECSVFVLARIDESISIREESEIETLDIL